MLENSVEPKGPDAATPASPEVGGQPGSPSHVQLKSMSYAAGKQALAPAAQLKAAKKHVLSQEDVEDAVAWYKCYVARPVASP